MPENPDAIILCGGSGSRLREITKDTPKAMATIAGRPFLELLLRQLRRHCFHRVILAVSYHQELIRAHFGTGMFDLELEYSIESVPLGTGGALGNAAHLVRSTVALVVNGDSYTDTDLRDFIAAHQRLKADISVVAVPANGRTDCGRVSVDPNQRVEHFSERQWSSGAQFANAGIYAISTALLAAIPQAGALSLETTLLPQWIMEGRYVRAHVAAAKCIDIGTPERYHEAQHILADVELSPYPPSNPLPMAAT